MPPIELTLRLLLAAGLGTAMGVERELRRKPAGLRTNILIAVGATLFTTVSVQLARMGGTPDRIAAQIVTGIGFLGAGEYAMAAVATGITLVLLAVLAPIEAHFERRAASESHRHE